MRFSATLQHTAAVLALLACSAAAGAADLKLEVYNPGEKGIFPVSSEIVTAEHEAILIDAQFQRNDAEALVQKIRASGKKLTTVYISQGDPDYYFGLGVIHAAFPDAAIVASKQTVAIIQAQMDGKLAYWSPILKQNAPTALVLPAVLKGDSLTLEGKKLEIKGLTGASPERTYVWIPSLKTVAGGVLVNSATHVWVADTQTAASRRHWQAALDSIAALKPAVVVPGHFLGAAPQGLDAVRFTSAYLTAFERAAAAAPDAAALTAAMQARYPALGAVPSLEISAKVIKGEMKWPQ